MKIGQGGGLRTVYGYESAGGSRTGIMLTFSQDGQAFVVDIDGPSSDEAANLELADIVAASWTSRPVAVAHSGRWLTSPLDGLGAVAPSDFRYSHMSNGWHRFAGSNDQVFVAIRTEPIDSSGLFGRMEHWIEVAGRNADDFAASAPRTVERGDRTWTRADFEYLPESGDLISGLIMSTRVGDRDIVVWMEAPADQYPRLESEILMVMIDELSYNALP